MDNVWGGGGGGGGRGAYILIHIAQSVRPPLLILSFLIKKRKNGPMLVFKTLFPVKRGEMVGGFMF